MSKFLVLIGRLIRVLGVLFPTVLHGDSWGPPSVVTREQINHQRRLAPVADLSPLTFGESLIEDDAAGGEREPVDHKIYPGDLAFQGKEE